MEMVVDRNQQKVFGMTPERAIDSYNRIRSEYNNKNKKQEQLPGIQELKNIELGELKNLVTKIDQCFKNLSDDEARNLFVPFDYEIVGFN